MPDGSLIVGYLDVCVQCFRRETEHRVQISCLLNRNRVTDLVICDVARWVTRF